MGASFKCGSVVIPKGVSELAVEDISLPFEPAAVHIQVRQPAANAPLISGFLTGEADSLGFTVALSATTELDGYILSWTAFSEGSIAPAVDTDTLAVSYNDLQRQVATFLGWDLEAASTYQKQQIDDIIQSGLRQFYYPPAMEGVDSNHKWTFLKLQGSVTLLPGVSEYQLPDGFGRIVGQITVEGDAGKTVPTIPFGMMMNYLNFHEYAGRPQYANVMAENAFGGKGQAKKLRIFPRPDKAYTITFAADSDTGKIDPDKKPFPLGGHQFSELIIESCLAIAEQRINDERGNHTAAFQSQLIAAIQRDYEQNASYYGAMGEPGAKDWDL